MDRFRRRAGFRYLWLHQQSADPHRSASGAEHHRLVPDWRNSPMPQALYSGDISRFYAGIGAAGCLCQLLPDRMMFGLPGAALLAMYFAARRRTSSDGGRYAAVCRDAAFLTGVTEPLEFLFMFWRRCWPPPARHFDRYQPVRRDVCWVSMRATLSRRGAIDYVLMYNLLRPAITSGCCW